MGVCARIKMEGAPSQAVAYKPASAFVASFSSYLLDVVHLPDHSKVATADSDRTIKLFDATTSLLTHTSSSPPQQTRVCARGTHDQEIARSPSHREVNAKVWGSEWMVRRWWRGVRAI